MFVEDGYFIEEDGNKVWWLLVVVMVLVVFRVKIFEDEV